MLVEACFKVADMTATLAERITKAREEAGMSKSDLARRVGVSASAVGQWENGETKTIEGENLLKVAAACNVDPMWLATGRGSEHPRMVAAEEMTSLSPYRVSHAGGQAVVIPVFDARGSMGPGAMIPEHDTVVGGMQLSEKWVSRNLPGVSSVGNLSVISAIGDSMSPTFNDGDILLVDRGVFELKTDSVYVLAKDDELFIKRVRRRLSGPGVVIKSDNPLHGEEDVEDPEAVNLRVLGRVVWAWNGKRL